METQCGNPVQQPGTATFKSDGSVGVASENNALSPSRESTRTQARYQVCYRVAEEPETGARVPCASPSRPSPAHNTCLRQSFVFCRKSGLLSQRRHVVPEEAKDSAEPNTVEEASPHRRQTSCIAKVRDVLKKTAACGKPTALGQAANSDMKSWRVEKLCRVPFHITIKKVGFPICLRFGLRPKQGGGGANGA